MNGNHTDSLPRDGRYFLCVAGAGPDGAIVNGVDEGLKKQRGNSCLLDRRRPAVFPATGFPEMRIRSDSHEQRATFVVLGRTAHYGGPFKITTGASLFEDSFEILTNSQRSRFAYLALPAGALAWQAAPHEGHQGLEGHSRGLRGRRERAGVRPGRRRADRPRADLVSYRSRCAFSCDSGVAST